MQRNNNTLLSLGLGLTLGSLAYAQQPQGDLMSVADRAHGISITEGRMFGVGPNYRAEFDTDGFEFIPALGRQVPHTMPVRFTLESVRRGDTIVHEAKHSRPQHAADRVTFSRGAGVVERYDIGVEGVEQSFVFARPFDGRGDLVVRGRLTTELRAEPGVYRDGIEFGSEFGGVHFGGVTGIGANGERTTGSIRFDGEHLELVLPERFADSANYPLVLDPLVSSVQTFNLTSSDDSMTDVAYEAFHDKWCIVYERALAGDSIDIRAQRANPDGSIVGPVLLVKASGVNLRPKIATVAGTQKFAVAWGTSSNVLGPFDIEVRSIASANGLMSPSIISAGTAFADNDVNVDLGGDQEMTGQNALMVWQVIGGGLRAATVNTVLTDPTVSGAVTLTSNSTDAFPAISKSGGQDQQWLLTWQRNTNVRARLIDRNFNSLGEVFLGNGERPDVDGNGQSFCVVYQRNESSSPDDHDVWCSMVNYDASTLSISGAASAISADASEDEAEPFVAFALTKYLVGWINETPSFLETNVTLAAISSSNCESCGQRADVSATNPYSFGAAAASTWSAGDASDDVLVSFSAAEITPPWESNIHGQRFTAVGAGGAITNEGGGCGGGGTCSIVGAMALSNTISITLTGADPNAFIAALHFGGTNAVTVPCGTCTIISPFLAFPVTPVGGSASVDFTIGCSSGFLDESFQFQFALGGTLASPCPLVPAISVSNIERGVFGL